MESIRNYIPNFQELHDKVCEFVISQQGEKGYIPTTEEGCDTIYAIEYDYGTQEAIERIVYGVRVRGNDIQVITEPIANSFYLVYTDEDFKKEENWKSIQYGDIYYVHTIISIAESIEEYCDIVVEL